MGHEPFPVAWVNRVARIGLGGSFVPLALGLILKGVRHWSRLLQPDLFLHVGVAVLILTPAAVVVAICAGFVAQRQYRWAAVAAAVLVILAVAVLFGAP